MSERTFDNVKITSSFDVPETGGNLVSGETIGKHFGKIAKHMEIVKAELDKKADKSEIPTELPANGGNADTANKLVSSSYTTLTISISDWTVNSSGGYVCTKTLSSAMAYEHFNFEVVLSSEQASAKLQIESWNYIMADGMITQTTSNGSTTAFTFKAFTTKPTVELIVAIQGVS